MLNTFQCQFVLLSKRQLTALHNKLGDGVIDVVVYKMRNLMTRIQSGIMQNIVGHLNKYVLGQETNYGCSRSFFTIS